MTDFPVIFSAPMVRALLAGRKTMTRRLAWTPRRGNTLRMEPGGAVSNNPWNHSPWRKVKPGDRLWVRENVQMVSAGPGVRIGLVYQADDPLDVKFFDPPAHKMKPARMTPSIHMPRWASRITLNVTATKIERLRKISEKDAIAEGCVEDWADGLPIWYVPGAGMKRHGGFAIECFSLLWTSLHGTDSWVENPDVVALTFGVERKNIDQIATAA